MNERPTIDDSNKILKKYEIVEVPDEIKEIKEKYSYIMKESSDYVVFYNKMVNFFDGLEEKYNLEKQFNRDLRKHTIYNTLISSTDPNSKSWLDFSQDQIESDEEIKQFVEIDFEIKKFIENEYNELIKQKNNSSS